VALAWFELPRLMDLTSRLCPSSPKAPANCCTNLQPVTPYRRALAVWTECLLSARLQASSWRLAAAGSATLCVVLAFALAIAVSRAAVIPYVVHLDRLNAPQAAYLSQRVPSDAQIAYFLARFVKNIRSRSIDPIVVRSNWEDALNYAADRAAQTLSDYARDTNAFAQSGLRPIVVEVLYVVRASDSSFEIHWEEERHARGLIVQTSAFTGTADIILKPTSTADALKNPVGLYVRTFRWSRDDAK
jgi:type IV secretion system protein VirB5